MKTAQEFREIAIKEMSTPDMVKAAKVKRTGEIVNVFLERYKTNPYYVVGKFPDHYWWDELEFIN